jgi:hypothetical protein
MGWTEAAVSPFQVVDRSGAARSSRSFADNSMATNPYDTPAIESLHDERSLVPDSREVPRTRPSYWRYAIATLATVAFLALGYMFLVSMRGRQWLEASVYLAGSLSAIPWALHESRARDCCAGSIVIAVASLCAAASQVCYFAMFEFEWFNGIFNDKGAGEFGMLLFGSVAFVGSGYLCWRLLALIGLTSPPSQPLRNTTESGEPSDAPQPRNEAF